MMLTDMAWVAMAGLPDMFRTSQAIKRHVASIRFDDIGMSMVSIRETTGKSPMPQNASQKKDKDGASTTLRTKRPLIGSMDHLPYWGYSGIWYMAPIWPIRCSKNEVSETKQMDQEHYRSFHRQDRQLLPESKPRTRPLRDWSKSGPHMIQSRVP